jgi:hypothetical protein
MNQCIIYSNGIGGICLIMPTGELSVEEVARKDVPAGTSYIILNTDQVPADHTFFSAWEADFNASHGVGIGADAWFAEQEGKQ